MKDGERPGSFSNPHIFLRPFVIFHLTRELENFPEGEIKEMVELYTSKGLSESDARAVVEILSKNEPFFVDIMMLEELEIAPYRGLPPFQDGFMFLF
jgi:hypothetical protein